MGKRIRFAKRRHMRIGIIVSIAAVVVLIGVLVWVFNGRAPVDRPANVLLITVDTLRPDRLGYGGHNRDTSPTIDGLAARSLVFPNVYSVSGWTLPSVATLLTGRYPRDHGATDFHWAVDSRMPTMAGILKNQGYDTRGFVSHLILTPSYGVAEGFRSFDYSVLNIGHPHEVSTGRQLTDLVIESTADMTEPYFLWVHYFDPHFEYVPHSQWSHFGGEDVDRYDQEVAFTDAQISRLLDHLERRGLFDNTITVFTSDHGEEFGEHGDKFHYTLYEEVMRCPLVINAPLLEPAVDDRIVEQIDILPTVLSMLDLEVDSLFPGRILLGEDSGERPVFVERDRPPPYNQRGVILGDYKLTVIEEVDPASIPRKSQGTESPVVNVSPGIYMYDLSTDPGETQNIYDESDPKAIKLLVMLAEHFSVQATTAHEVEIDETLRDKLRSLGYID
jgi:arylsulfatase A-like enzyme